MLHQRDSYKYSNKYKEACSQKYPFLAANSLALKHCFDQTKTFWTVLNYYAFMEIANRANYSSDLAASILTFMKVHYGFNLNCVPNRKIELKTAVPVIYPNPAIVGEGLRLLSPQTISGYTVISSMGQALSKSNKPSELILQEGQAGIYIIKIVYNNGTIQYQKVILN